MRDLIFIADFFSEDITGGAELHDAVVVEHLESKGVLETKIKSSDVSVSFLEKNRAKKYMIGNFVNLSFECLDYLSRNCEYIIYEHDYKFINVRNPISFPDFVVPDKNLVNLEFYESAKKVICLSQMQRKIFDKNLKFDNITNINCSMWSDRDLQEMSKLSSEKKLEKIAIINSRNPIKKTKEAVEYCRKNNLEFDLISSTNYHEFLAILSKYSKLLFLTGHPEPTPRVAIEAKILNCELLSQKELIGVAHEEYFNMSGLELLSEVKRLRDESLEKIFYWLYEGATNNNIYKDNKDKAFMVHVGEITDLQVKCLSSLRKHSPRSEVYLYTIKAQTPGVERLEPFNVNIVEIDPEKWNNRMMTHKIELARDFFHFCEEEDNILILDSDLYFQGNPFTMFYNSKSDVFITSRGYRYVWTINAGVWGMRKTDKTKKFLDFYISQIHTPTWDELVKFRKRFSRTDSPNWWVDQDFLCVVHDSGLPPDYDDLAVEDVGCAYNYCPGTDLLGKAGAAHAITSAIGSEDYIILHLKADLKDFFKVELLP